MFFSLACLGPPTASSARVERKLERLETQVEALSDGQSLTHAGR